MSFSLRLRRDQAADWTANNPILHAGEPGVELDTGKFKVGDGVTPWVSLPYFLNEPVVTALIQTIVNEAVLTGVPGPAGDSAYQVAVNNGFVGTQSAWLASLVGPAGSAGPAGADGQSVTVTLVPAASWPPAADSNPLHLYFRVP